MNKQLTAVVLVFIVSTVGLSLVFGTVFDDSIARGIAPAIAVSVGIALAAHFALSDRRT